jgi:ubiquinone/menaquinone biosynthesis C-methylase UbiE
MERYKEANREKYLETSEACKFATHPSKIVKMEGVRRDCRLLVADGETILDIGGGAGVWTQIFREQNIDTKTYALDISAAMLKERPDPDVKILGDLEALPFRDGSFDRVLIFAALHHVRDTQRALAEAKRVVRPQGHIVLSEPTSVGMLLSGKDIEPVPGDEVEFRFSIKYLLRVIHALGLRITYLQHMGLCQRLWPSKKKSVFAYRLLDHLDRTLNRLPLIGKSSRYGSHVTVVARKP